jgi:hypothetical protein
VGKDKIKRASNDRHVRIYRYMWPALLERLDGNAFKALFYMLTFEDGGNNGQIFMGARMLGDGTGIDKKTALRCLQHLDRQGFIRPEQLGYFQQKGGPATRWRFTFLAANGKPPTNEWRQPPAEQKSWGENFPDAGGEIPPVHSVRRATGGKNGPVIAELGRRSGGKKGTQTIASGEGSRALGNHVNLDPDFAGGRFPVGEAGMTSDHLTNGDFA